MRLIHQLSSFCFSQTSARACLLSLALALTSCDSRSDIERANEENILIIGNSNEPKGLDPHLVSGVLESNIIRALFEGLCIDAPDKDNVALPGAAASWKSNDDSTFWTFNLQPEGRWSDGTRVTARDFVFSYRRMLSPDPNWPSEYSEMLYFIENAEKYSSNRRGEILFNNAAFPISWEILKKINFSGDNELKLGDWEGQNIKELSSEASEALKQHLPDLSKLSLEAITQTPFKELSKAQKRISIASRGLDSLGKKELEYLLKNPKAFVWPEEIEDSVRKRILERMLAEADTDLWELAHVGVHAADDYTLEIQLRGPVPFLPEITKHYTWYPVPRHIILKHGEMNTAFSSPWTKVGNLVSNGPFKLKSWRTNHYLEVEKNETYWDSDIVSLSGIRYLPVNNYYTESRMFADEQVHVTYTVPSELIPWAKEKHTKSLRQEPYVGTRFFRINTNKKPLNNPDFRRALALAIDRSAICDDILQGGQTPATGIVPEFGNYIAAGRLNFNPEKAKKALAKSGYKTSNGLAEITLLTTDSDSGRREAEALQAMWSQNLGIKVEIVQREWATYLEKQYTSDYDICVAGWIGDYLDPTTFLEMWLKDGGNNNTGWFSDEFQTLLRKAENTANPDQRITILSKAENLLLDDLPVIPMYWYTTNYLIRPEVKNWNPLLLNNHPFKFVSLEPASSGKN